MSARQVANSAIRVTSPKIECIAGSRRGDRRRPAADSRHTELPEAAVLTFCLLTSAAAVAWLYLLALHGGYWRTSHRLPPVTPARLPAVTAVIPARNEADMLPGCLPSLLCQDYAGPLTVIVVDDDSSDGTAKIAAELGDTAGGAALTVVAGRPTPDGWAGKVWAMSEGVRAAGPAAEYLLFTDADISFAPGALARLARAAAAGDFAMVSQMALLRAVSRWEKLLIPAFVYFFAQLYPFPRVSRQRSRTAAAAGGCMLVRADALAAAGGLARISGARIDDVALGTLLKRAGGRCWLGLTAEVVSERPYDRLADIWNMVARSAYTQLRHSLAATAGAVLGLAWLYLLPPAAAISGLIMLGAGGPTVGHSAGRLPLWLACAGLAGWLVMTVTYLPMVRFYRLRPMRAASLPLIAALYAAMTADSARRHHRGRGGEWKGRTIGPADAR